MAHAKLNPKRLGRYWAAEMRELIMAEDRSQLQARAQRVEQ